MIRTPDLGVMIARLVVAVLITGAFVSLGLWASSTSVLAWLATVATMTVATLISGALAPLSLSHLEGGRFAPVLEVLRSHPVVARLATDRAVHVALALAGAVLVATTEAAIATTILAGLPWPPLATGALALALVLVPAWTVLLRVAHAPDRPRWGARLGLAIVEWARQVLAPVRTVLLRLAHDPDRPTWCTRPCLAIAEWAELEIRPSGPWTAAVTGAVLRTGATVIARLGLVIVLPLIFGNTWATVFVATITVATITAGDVIRDLIGALRGPTAPADTQEVGR